MNDFNYREKRKIREHLTADPTGKSLIRYSCKWFTQKIFRKASKRDGFIPGNDNIIYDDDKILVAARITGGLGDYVVISRVIRELFSLSDGKLRFYIFCSAPGKGQWVWKNDSFVEQVYDEIFYDNYSLLFDCTLFLNQFIYYDERIINIEKIMRLAPKFGKALASCQKKRKDWNIFIENHPVLDGAFAHTAVALNYNRHNYIYHLLGISAGKIKQDFFLDDSFVADLRKKHKKWITINTGFDDNFVISEKIATKCYPQENWNKALSLLREKIPDIAIIQIGGEKSYPIQGVHENLAGKTTIAQAVGVLKESILHIDIEGGLVHIAAGLGIKSVVLFGPTSIDYFGYPDNINLKSDYCGDCWWTTERWMEACPRNHGSARCLKLLSPERVVEAVDKELRNMEVL